MKVRYSHLMSAISCAVLLTACGGGGSDDITNTTAVTTSDPNPDEAFFNDAAKFGYVDSMLGRFLSVFRPISNLAGDDLAKMQSRMTETETVSCSGGGSIVMSVTAEEGSPAEVEISLSNCVEDGETSNGSIALSADLDDAGDNGTISITASNFTVTGGDEDIAMNGAVTVSVQSTDSVETFSISGSSFSLTAGGESISISNYNITAVDNIAADSATLDAAMTVSSNVDGTVTFSIAPTLELNDSDVYPSSGTLTMTHSDGSALSINANNGDLATFDYVISDGTTTTSGVQRWDETELGDL